MKKPDKDPPMEPLFSWWKSNRATRLLGSPGWFVHQLQISWRSVWNRGLHGMEKPGVVEAHLLGFNFVETMFDGKKKLHRFLGSIQCHVSCCCCFFAVRWIRGKYVPIRNTSWFKGPGFIDTVAVKSNWYNPNAVRAHSPTTNKVLQNIRVAHNPHSPAWIIKIRKNAWFPIEKTTSSWWMLP